MPETLSISKPLRTEDELADRLQVLIEELSQAYEKLDALADRRRGAISTADMRSLADCARQESQEVERLAALDQTRASIVRDAAHQSRLDPAKTTLSQLACALADPWRDAVVDAAGSLRSLIERVQRKNAATRLAAETLAKHMQGLLRTAEGMHSHSGAYSRSGAVRVGSPVVTALDCAV